MKRLLPLAFVIILSCNTGTEDPVESTIDGPQIPEPQNLTASVYREYPHDTSAYTQGLELYDGKLYESTGDYNNSSLRITDYTTGKVEQLQPLGKDSLFGEGITIFKDKIYQLTWQDHKVFVYDVHDISKPIKTLDWKYDGWGITHDSTNLYISDGSSNIYVVAPENLKIQTSIAVRTSNGNVDAINEMEYVDGYIYANKYMTDYILKIDPKSGLLVGIISLKDLLKPAEINDRTDVLNGIAYKKESNTFLITGKRWPKLFEIRLN
jgi:glutamine cyclotransferase